MWYWSKLSQSWAYKDACEQLGLLFAKRIMHNEKAFAMMESLWEANSHFVCKSWEKVLIEVPSCKLIIQLKHH